jgi:hypothetical protein
MIQWRRLGLWFALVLVVLLIAAVALWLRGMVSGSHQSPLPTPVASQVSPLPSPMPTSAAAPPPSWTGGGPALLWVALGVVLALGITFVILRWQRRAAS